MTNNVIQEQENVGGAKDYELAFVIENEGDAQEILKLVGQHKSEVRFEAPLRKISLAYKIKKVAQAYFGFLRIRVLPSDIKSLEKDLQLHKAIMRFLIVCLPKEKAASEEAPKHRTGVATRKPPVLSPTRPPEVLSNEALEKKIEEILK